jgi:tripartite-type tricarboxylate transporter receptor subunit TctC
VIKRLADEAVKATKAPVVKERFAADDAIAFGSTPAEFAAFIKQEQRRWGEVVKKAKLKAD